MYKKSTTSNGYYQTRLNGNSYTFKRQIKVIIIQQLVKSDKMQNMESP